ncbi:pyridoxal-phosphate dependent enzyme [Streptomyces sp. B6B3]|uniref:threonine synthase n=1 Tax=Streptomyces sp. B6B3 TaxID=3153570 RepID=UPI00325D9E69
MEPGAGAEVSLARGQRSLGDPDVTYPLWPPLTDGCPRTSTDEVAYPVEVDYDYERLPADLFATRESAAPRLGLERWGPLLPPLAAPGLGEGQTPLVDVGDGVFVKDESRNPTWSHKDRLNRCSVSAAVGVGAPGVLVASSGNHGASAAAFAARAGLRCVVLTSPEAPPAVRAFMDAYGAVVLPVPVAERWPLARTLMARCGLHPVSSSTVTHTGHPFGVEGYKTVAYEIFTEIGVPEAVFVPTGYGELLFGVWKGFAELRRLGLATHVPRLYGCEPAAGGPLHAALRQGRPAAVVDLGPTDAYAIACPVGGYRGVLAIAGSGGRALLVTDDEMRAARAEAAAQGLWMELSSAAGLAGLAALRREGPVDGPVVCVTTSSGFKDRDLALRQEPEPAVSSASPDAWPDIARRLTAAGIEVG